MVDTLRPRSLVEFAERMAALALVVALAPLLAVAAAAILLDSRGPILFRQIRVGLDGRHFHIFKFRTMRPDSECSGHGLACASDDERVTRVGRCLRRTSIDELPQLINVVFGDMSIIGPRPTVPSQVEKYTGHQRRRLEVKPGLTGWAQVNGRNALSWEDRIELDVWYVDHRSTIVDIRIILRTPRAMIESTGVYGKGGVTADFPCGTGDDHV